MGFSDNNYESLTKGEKISSLHIHKEISKIIPEK